LGVLLKIAIFHDSFDQIGGAEKAALLLAKDLKADIITTIAKKEILEKLDIQGVNIIQQPILSEKTPFKQFFTCIAFLTMDFSKKYDFFILSGRLTAFAAVKHKPNIYICMDLMREFYDLKEYYNTRLPLLMRLTHSASFFVFKPLFENSLKSIQKIIAVSKDNQKKIKKYYKRNSEIVYLPIDCENFSHKKSKGYCLSVNRIYPAKRIELQLEAFKLTPEKRLVIVGDYAKGDEKALGYVKKILAQKPKNVEIISRPTQKKLKQLYSECDCFLATSKEEAFGLAVIEAMASGKPIVAVNEGGFKETVLNNKTGFLVNPEPQEIVKAIKEISKNPEKFKKNCQTQALKFDSKKFFEKIKKLIKSQIENS